MRKVKRTWWLLPIALLLGCTESSEDPAGGESGLSLEIVDQALPEQVSLSVSCADVYSRSPLEDLTRCVQQGHAGAQSALGLKYASGAGVPEDDVEAVRWYRLAAEQGHAETQWFLGSMYGDGDGVPQDDVLAYMYVVHSGGSPRTRLRAGEQRHNRGADDSRTNRRGREAGRRVDGGASARFIPSFSMTLPEAGFRAM